MKNHFPFSFQSYHKTASIGWNVVMVDFSFVERQNASDAPVRDLMLWEFMNPCEKYEPGVPKADLLTFNGHLWYLSEGAVTYFLFSKKVSDSEKKISENP
ncbi:hypothetical protein AVEN_40189-1 [Araneus ventricosus]|uniref:Uncharacterized protein n=1 Tax=Araneus ventricosus TaxID=182803 RepID=A0A4Y2E1R4_ARAVE|nr:hypothetical protein AVEN_40189-1 [Araneus ventricosus]